MIALLHQELSSSEKAVIACLHHPQWDGVLNCIIKDQF